MFDGARWRLCWLLFFARGVCQANRVLLGALLPYLSADVPMSSQVRCVTLTIRVQALPAGKGIGAGGVLDGIHDDASARCGLGLRAWSKLWWPGGSAADRFGGKALVLFAISAYGRECLLLPKAHLSQHVARLARGAEPADGLVRHRPVLVVLFRDGPGRRCGFRGSNPAKRAT